ncbi:MAG: hypothetical protein QOJ31_163 [Gaiellales bacterium]|jgi:hypothetical protein|nr:hypothetical protein [Gaiellales bacterium]
METIVTSLFVAIGAVLIVFAHPIARHGVSLRFSEHQLRATAGPDRPRIRRLTVIATVLNIAIGAAFVYGGVQ